MPNTVRVALELDAIPHHVGSLRSNQEVLRLVETDRTGCQRAKRSRGCPDLAAKGRPERLERWLYVGAERLESAGYVRRRLLHELVTHLSEDIAERQACFI